MSILSFISSGLGFRSENLTSMYENAESKFLKMYIRLSNLADNRV